MEELESVKKQCARLRVLIFGSYITSKKKPGDIDVLISLIPNKDCVYRIVTRGLQHRHPREVDIHYYKTQRYIKDADGLIRHFNKNRINELKGVSIKKAIEIKDI
ncbi:MAG: hypothetical protein JW807_07385 [Spirochaetes bacterium]|nr:hypothetical protein [Spirochaetota bacterium]